MIRDMEKPTRVELGAVLNVWRSGLVDVQMDNGSIYSQIRTMAPGAEETLIEGDRVVVMDNSEQIVIFGRIHELVPTEDGPSTLSDNPWAAAGARVKRLRADDDLGQHAEVVVGPGTGVVLDTGAWCSVLLAPDQESVTVCAKRLEMMLPGVSALVDSKRGVTTFGFRLSLAASDDALLEQIEDGKIHAGKKGLELIVSSYGDGLGEGGVVGAWSNGGASKLTWDVNAADGELTLWCAGRMSVTTVKDMELVAGEDALLRAGGKITLERGAGKIYLGSSSASVPLASSSKTEAALADIIQKFNAHTHSYTDNGNPATTSSPTLAIISTPNVASPNVLAEE